MASSNGNNNGDRLDRIEAIVESNSRLLQAMLEQRATDRLEHEERMDRLEELSREHQARMDRLEEVVTRLTRIEEAQNRMLANLDDRLPNGSEPFNSNR